MWKRQGARSVLCGRCCELYLKRAMIGMFALVWWGLLYPELCFTEETYEQIFIVEGEEVVAKQPDLQGILDASGDEIVVKSRFLEWLEQRIGEWE